MAYQASHEIPNANTVNTATPWMASTGLPRSCTAATNKVIAGVPMTAPAVSTTTVGTGRARRMAAGAASGAMEVIASAVSVDIAAVRML